MPTLAPSGLLTLVGEVNGSVFRDGIIWMDDYYDAPIGTYASNTAAMQAAVNAAVTAGQPLECTAGKVYSLDVGTVQLAPNVGPLTINGHFCTWQSNWANPRCLDLVRTVDYCTFQNIEINDIIFDANSLTSTTNQSVVGNVGGYGVAGNQRINATNITFRRCSAINVPVGTLSTGPGYIGFGIYSNHLAGGEAQTGLSYIRFEQIITRGGNSGVVVAGQCSTANTACEVYHDHIYVDSDSNAGITPNTTWSTSGNCGVQIGGLGFGDYCEVHIDATNVGDVGVEIDGFNQAEVWGTVTDFRVAGFFARNFHAPSNGLDTQRIIFHGCRSVIQNCQPGVGTQICQGYLIGHSTLLPNPGFGETVLEDCKHLGLATTLSGVGDAISVQTGALTKRLTIAGTFRAVYPNINYQPGSSINGVPIWIVPGAAGWPEFTIGGGGDISVFFAGTGGTNLSAKAVVLSPNNASTEMTVDLGDISIENSLAGQASTKNYGVSLGLNGYDGGSIRGRIKRIAWAHYSSSDATPALFTVRPSTTLTIDGRFVVDEVDLRKDPAALPAIVNGAQSVDTTNRALVAVNSANMPTYPIASGAMGTTYFASATWTTATGNQYIGALPAEICFATGTGAAVTAISASKDGTTYETFWTQASGALSQNVWVPVECGDFVMVTFTTTAPTARIRRRRAQ